MGDYLKLFKTHAEYQTYAQSGDMIKPNVSHCVTEYHVHYNPWTWAEEYLTFVAKENGTFTFTPYNNNVVRYSTDGGEKWTEGNSIEVNAGDKVMWKGTMITSYGIGKFGSTANFDVQGNIMSLLYGDKYKGQTDLTGKNYVFYHLFYENTKIISAENLSLPAATLANDCYERMFEGCTSLTTAPELPARTMVEQCYNGMFQGCTNLTTAPELPATTLAHRCYYHMFDGCTSLTTAPELPAKTLAERCYETMFNRCTSLTTAPELPATTLANYCYNSMFNGCTSLTTAPELPATTLVDSCYNWMFYDCRSLNYIKAMFTTTPSDDYTDKWVDGVSATGTFVKNGAATWNVTGVHGVPSGWTVQTASA